MPAIEQALETAALMFGTDKSRRYCLEMICSDFLASNALPHLISRFFKFVPHPQKHSIRASFGLSEMSLSREERICRDGTLGWLIGKRVGPRTVKPWRTVNLGVPPKAIL